MSKKITELSSDKKHRKNDANADLNHLINITKSRIFDIHNRFSLDDPNISKVYLDNVKALSILYRLLKSNDSDHKNVLDYEDLLEELNK